MLYRNIAEENKEGEKEFRKFYSIEKIKDIKIRKEHFWQQFCFGAACGVAFLIINIVQLNVNFVNLDPKKGGDPCRKEKDEYFIKLSNILTFLIGLVVCAIGFFQTRR